MVFQTTTHSILYYYNLQFHARDNLQTNMLPLRELDIYICLSLLDSHNMSLPVSLCQGRCTLPFWGTEKGRNSSHRGMLPLWFWLCSHVLLG